ncbi:hypothetical protein PROFUN_15269 [Planoprotostelium fungivorum]|uniref:C2H2-type domain-containing protein n=1 Tax=Planoprotostelium fungivorum TaxID=1890364 RepID=A0A2P6MXE1_9EUKA|nr:hypothetical protein PROFUN_15269 [Planoprotostelium fungivorum]
MNPDLKDNLCFWSKIQREKAITLRDKYFKQCGQSTTDHVQVADLPAICQALNLDLTVYTLDSNLNSVKLYKSGIQGSAICLHLDQVKNHYMLLRTLVGYAETVICDKCKKVFAYSNSSKYHKHMDKHQKDQNNNKVLVFKDKPIQSSTQYKQTFGTELVRQLQIGKDKCNMKSAKHVGSAILSWSKVLMLDFVYNCLYQNYERTEVDLLYTDTDSIYMQVSAYSYEEFKQRFPDHLQKLHFAAAGDITPGKMKLECELREAVFVKPKTYSYVKKDGKQDIKNKGVVLSQNKEILIFDSYKRAVFSARVNIGMGQLKIYLQCTQDQLKTHLTSHFDPGMSLMNYGVLWNLDHTIPVSFAKDNLKALCHYSNIEPMLISENSSKCADLGLPKGV